MAKKFDINMDSFNTPNNMDSIYAGNTPIEVETPLKAESIKANRGIKNNENKKEDHTKNNGINKKDNYTLNIKIDSDLEDYFKNILWINRKTKSQYVNDLIRKEMLEKLELKENATYEEVQDKWQEYKSVNNI